jgi:hypothetical protein
MKIRYILKNNHTKKVHIKKYSISQIEKDGLGGLFDVNNYEIISRDRFTGEYDNNKTEIYENDQLYVCPGYQSIVSFQDGMFVSVYNHPEDGETLPLIDVLGKDTSVIPD